MQENPKLPSWKIPLSHEKFLRGKILPHKLLPWPGGVFGIAAQSQKLMIVDFQLTDIYQYLFLKVLIIFYLWK